MDNIEKNAREKAEELAKKIANVLDSKKAVNIKLLKLTDETIQTDYFVIANGTSTTHVKNLAGEVEFKLGQEGVKPAHAEGMAGNSWILLDYTTVIVHVFTKEARDFYNLERLWADAEAVEFKATED